MTVTHRSRTTLILAAVFTAYWLVALRLDAGSDATRQAMIGSTAWIFLAAALWFSPWHERIQVCTMVGVATFFEVLSSLVLGAYTYRLDNLPLYVPPGHGLFYLIALRTAELPLLRRYARPITWSVLVGASALLLRNLLAPPLPDLFGLLTWVALLPFILRGRFALLYAVSFTMTMALEFYGTGLGTWTWAARSPLIGLPAANPPAGIGAGYCIMDGITRWLAPQVQRLLRRAFAVAQARVRRRGAKQGWPLPARSTPGLLQGASNWFRPGVRRGAAGRRLL
jgi:hypothetical protein